VDKANPASVPRSERIIRHASCLVTDLLGDIVKVTGPRTGNLWSVTKIPSNLISPTARAVGVIIKKTAPTSCFVQFHGPTPFVVYTSLTAGLPYVVGTDARPATLGDLNYPPPSHLIQGIGTATSNDELLVQPSDAGSSSLDASSHATLPQLLHLADGQGGPWEDYLSGAFRETLPLGNPFPTSIVWWTDSSKTKKIVDKFITYNPNKTPATITWAAYDIDGVTVVSQIRDTFTYSAVFEISRTRTILVP
jgi:hypothetical protein